jgi:hypothetical protein
MADTIGPDHAPKRSFGEKVKRISKSFTTKYVAITTPGGVRGVKTVTDSKAEMDLLGTTTMRFSSSPTCHS